MPEIEIGANPLWFPQEGSSQPTKQQAVALAYAKVLPDFVLEVFTPYMRNLTLGDIVLNFVPISPFGNNVPALWTKVRPMLTQTIQDNWDIICDKLSEMISGKLLTETRIKQIDPPIRHDIQVLPEIGTGRSVDANGKIIDHWRSDHTVF